MHVRSDISVNECAHVCFVRERVGKSVTAALSLQYAGPKGVSMRYLRNDLKWDLDHGFLEMPFVPAGYVSRFSLGAAGVGGGGPSIKKE